MNRASAVASGIALAVVINFLALGLAGGGDGWVTPLSVSWAAFIMAPAAFFLLVDDVKHKLFLIAACISFALLLDYWIIYSTESENIEYFYRSETFSYVWVLFWISWQIVIAYAALMNILNSV